MTQPEATFVVNVDTEDLNKRARDVVATLRRETMAWELFKAFNGTESWGESSFAKMAACAFDGADAFLAEAERKNGAKP